MKTKKGLMKKDYKNRELFLKLKKLKFLISCGSKFGEILDSEANKMEFQELVDPVFK
jgi:hypothetical protein